MGHESASQLPLADGHVLGDYRIVQTISSGGFGIVYEARHNELNQRVAVKEFFPRGMAVRDENGAVLPLAEFKESFDWARKKFCDEAKLIVSLHEGVRHSSVVKVINFYRAHNTEYVIMDFEDGEQLKSRIGKQGPMSEHDLLVMAGPVLDGLAWVHKSNMLHRDIKPDNIIIRKDGTPVLVDFGAAKNDFANTGVSTMAAYTQAYAAPEQIVPGLSPQGPWTDIFALGGTLYFAATGKVPGGGPDREYPFGFSAKTKEAIECALRPDYKARPKDISEFRALLGLQPQKVAEDRSTASTPADTATQITAFNIPAADISSPSNEPAHEAPRSLPLPSERTEIIQTSTRSRWPLWLTAVCLPMLALAGYWFVSRNTPEAIKSVDSEPVPAVSPVPPESVEVSRSPAQAPAVQPVADAAESSPTAVAVTREQLLERIGSVLDEPIECSFLQQDLSETNVLKLSGIVPSADDIDNLKRAFTAVPALKSLVTDDLAVVEKPFCEVISAVLAGSRPTTPESTGAIDFSNPDAVYHEGQLLVVTVRPAPLFAGLIYADLIDPSGNVVHLRSQLGKSGDPVEAGKSIIFGAEDGDAGQRQYRIRKPHGRHFLLVQQTREPLADGRPEVESVHDYAQVLAKPRAVVSEADKPLVYFRPFVTRD